MLLHRIITARTENWFIKINIVSHSNGMSQLFKSSQSQVYGGQHIALGTAQRQQLESLTGAQRAAFYEQTLVQRNPIFISPQGVLHKLEGQLSSMWQLTIPTHEHDGLAAEAAQVFYSRNEFMVSIGTVPGFVAWWVGNFFRPSDLVTRLAVLFGPPLDPGGGNGELLPLLSMPCLLNLRLIYEDYAVKGFGPYHYLRPSFGAVMELKNRAALALQLQLKNSGPVTSINGEGMVNEPLKDITGYLNPPTPADIQTVDAGNRALEGYRGHLADIANCLMDCGWTAVASQEFIVLRWRVMIMEWVNEQRSVSQDVEMS